MSGEIFHEGKIRNALIVVLHGLRSSPDKMRGVIDASASACPNADILAIPLPYSGWFGFLSTEPAECIAATVVRRIESALAAREQQGPAAYASIILVGHSFGGVIARKVAILAHGERQEAKFEPLIRSFVEPKPWADRIKRIVLLAGMSRGWSPDSARDWFLAAKWKFGSGIGEIITSFSAGRWRPTVAGIRQGAPFIVQTRLQWLALTRPRLDQSHEQKASARESDGQEETRSIFLAQLLGADDDLVAPDDSVDFACDADRDEANFALIELPFTTHDNAPFMKLPTDGQRHQIVQAIAERQLSVVCKREGLALQAKAYLFGRALSQSGHELRDIRIRPEDMMDTPAIKPDKDVTDIVFVIHGIRDHGFWTQKIARVIKQRVARENEGKLTQDRRHFHSFTGSYGYFAMIPFVLPWIRRWKSEWLMDRFVEACARFPNAKAKMSYVGHSNGTYLLARALQDYPALRLKRVVFAGSVVRRDFDWRTNFKAVAGADDPRVEKVLNYVATKDWVVGILSNAFQPLKFFFDLGSAGHDGFDQYKESCGQENQSKRNDGKDHDNKEKDCKRLFEVHYVAGEHSAALTETQWDDIAQFIVSGEPPRPPNVDFSRHRTWWLVMLGWISPVLVLYLLWLVFGFGIALTLSVHGEGTLQLTPESWVRTWDGWECVPGLAVSEMCRALSPIGEWLVSAVNWFLAALQGHISVPFAKAKPSELSEFPKLWAVVRGIACLIYWWLVYIVATRF